MGSASVDAFVRELKGFNQRKEILKQLRTEMRKPLPSVRKKIKSRALTTLPKSGGLNKWAASTKITARIAVTGRAVKVTVRGGRNSAGGESDIKALDRGRVRHPSWGRRGRGQWHVQRVTEGFFTEPIVESPEWREACLAAVDRALETIRG
jgi:hypothetical protein